MPVARQNYETLIIKATGKVETLKGIRAAEERKEHKDKTFPCAFFFAFFRGYPFRFDRPRFSI
jgi:hypothetical protein